MDIEEILAGEYDKLVYGLSSQQTPIINIVDLQNIYISSLYQWGFKNWQNKILLIPPWVFRLVLDGEEFLSILNEKRVKGVDSINVNTAANVMSYGFYHPQLS